MHSFVKNPHINLLLVVSYGQFEATEVHAFLQQASLVYVVLTGRVVQYDLQLTRVAGLSQQVLGEHLALLGKFFIIIPVI